MAAAAVEHSDHKHQFEPLPNIDEDMKYEVPPLDIDPNAKVDENRKRRFSVSAEASEQKQEKFIKKVYPKSKDALERITQSTVDVFLFQGISLFLLPLFIRFSVYVDPCTFANAFHIAICRYLSVHKCLC